MARFAVVGAGITGLAAAWELERLGHDVVVLDSAPRAGGKLQQSPVPGLDFPVDDGADAFLARVPEALELCDELGIEDLVHPATGDAWVYADGGLHRLPKGQLLGLPTDLDELAASGLVSAAGLARARRDLDSDAPPVTEDLSVGALVRGRLGDEVCDRLVEPLLGGINGGEADGLSTQACAAQIWAAATRGGSLVRAAAELRAAGTATGHAFATPAAGMAELPRALRARLGAEVRLGVAVPPLVAGRGGVAIGDETFAGAVLAVPADAGAALVRGVAPAPAAELATTDFASVVLVTLVAERGLVDHPLDGSGIVVSRRADVSITAGSWASSKWAHWNDGRHVVFRVSIGHDGDPRDWCARTDEALVEVAVGDLHHVMGTSFPVLGSRVRRWPRSFPQYRPGHLARVAELRRGVRDAGPIELAGMSFDGIGVPACIRSGRGAARHLDA